MSRNFKTALWVIALFVVWGMLALFAPAQLHLLLPAIAIALCASGYAALLRQRALQRWHTTNATLTAFEEREQEEISPPHSKFLYYYPYAEYEYRIGDTLYTSTVVALDMKGVRAPKHNGWGDLIDPATRPWHGWRAGDDVTAYVDPQDPQHAVLIRDISPRRRSSFHALIVGGVLIALVWLGLLNIL